MKKVKFEVTKSRKAEYVDLKVFDNLDEYLKEYNKGENFIRIGYEKWTHIEIDGKRYYAFSLDYDEYFLTEDVYKELLDNCEKTYHICECRLLRTQKHSNCRITSDLKSPQECVDYMLNDNGSWLPQICIEINEDIKKIKSNIKELEKKIKRLEMDKATLCDENYLRKMVETKYTFDYAKYKERKKENNKCEY